MRRPTPSAASVPLARGVVGLAGGLAWLPQTGSLLAADAHLAYEDVVGGALPLWSTDETIAYLKLMLSKMEARELIFLGDVIHGAQMSEGAARRIVAALDSLRARAVVTIVAGNHEGKTRGVATLGDVVEDAERDGWLLVHGDRPRVDPRPAIIGHVHPSLHLGGSATVPAFLACERVVIVPALTPYSAGLDVLSDECARALDRWTSSRQEVHVVGVTSDAVYPFGALSALRSLGRSQPRLPYSRFRRRLRAD